MNRPIIVRRFRGIVRYNFLSGYIESWGRGIEKIAHACQQHGIQPPTYDSGMSGLMLSFNASESYLSSINPEAADPVTGEVTTQETTQETTQKTTQKTTHERILALLRISLHLTRRRNIESRGRGIERISRNCLAHGIDAPIYDYSLSGLTLNIQATPQHLIDALGPQDVRHIAGERLGEKLGEKLGETRTAIINAMLSNARVTAVELARTLQISTTAVEKNLRILKEQGYIEGIGPAKGGHWQVKISRS